MRVVISGSRSIKSLPIEARERIDKVIELGADILVGDAPGIDALTQRYLKSKGYSRVTVYHAYKSPRNNTGFNTIAVSGNYSDRDKFMCASADYGLAIWDGVSRGTLANTKRVKTRVVRG
jgi:hypothetical protein